MTCQKPKMSFNVECYKMALVTKCEWHNIRNINNVKYHKTLNVKHNIQMS